MGRLGQFLFLRGLSLGVGLTLMTMSVDIDIGAVETMLPLYTPSGYKKVPLGPSWGGFTHPLLSFFPLSPLLFCLSIPSFFFSLLLLSSVSLSPSPSVSLALVL